MTLSLFKFGKLLLIMAAIAATMICFSGCAIVQDLNTHCKIESANDVGADFRVCVQCDSLAKAVKDWMKQ